MSDQTSSNPSSHHTTNSAMPLITETVDDFAFTADQIEHIFLQTLGESNRLAKSTDLTSKEVVMGKMINYCIRMLHSNGWIPRTVVRSMTHIEMGVEERSIKTIMRQSLIERRDAERVRRAAAQIAIDAGAGAGTGPVVHQGTGVHPGAGKVDESKEVAVAVEHKEETGEAVVAAEADKAEAEGVKE